jgi:hypothetical protein
MAARQFTDASASMHRRLCCCIRVKLRRIWFVHHPPEEFMALETGKDTGF